jgi:hypothetical protein
MAAYTTRDTTAATRLVDGLDETGALLVIAGLTHMALDTTQAVNAAGAPMPPQIRQAVTDLVGDVGGLGDEIAIDTALDRLRPRPRLRLYRRDRQDRHPALPRRLQRGRRAALERQDARAVRAPTSRVRHAQRPSDNGIELPAVILEVPGWVDYGLWSPCALPARDLPLRI